MIRHNVLFCLFWTKALFAMTIALFILFWFSWRIYDLHSRAGPPDAVVASQPISIIGTNGLPLASCSFADQNPGYARLEPQVKDVMLLGFSLDWSYDTPLEIVAKLGGYVPPVFNTFMELNADLPGYFDRNSLNWFGSEVGRVGGILELTLQPTTVNPALYTDEMYDAMAQALYQINTKYGVPVFFRFAHEMNGNWPVYGNKPTAFIAMFRRMTSFVRKYTNMTAMVWGPNVGRGYPFQGGAGVSPPPSVGDPDFAILDTNGNGVLDPDDDPYTPFYPGDDVVDWVGVSLYYYPPDEYHNYDVPPRHFEGTLLGNFFSQSAEFLRVHNFYENFCVRRNKPLMLPETGAPNIVEFSNSIDAGAVPEWKLKNSWWNQVFNTTVLQQYPMLKLAVNFEEQKVLAGLTRNWRLTNTSTVLENFKSVINGFKDHMVQGNEFVYGCDGSVKLAKDVIASASASAAATAT